MDVKNRNQAGNLEMNGFKCLEISYPQASAFNSDRIYMYVCRGRRLEQSE